MMGWRSSIEDVYQYHHLYKNNRNPKKTSRGGVVGPGPGDGHDSGAAVGLRILIHQYSKCDSVSNPILLKSKLMKLANFTNFHLHLSNTTKPHFPLPSCFLKSCFLCNKTLSPHQDVYMYRGDQGFCSEECRNRQIYVDEIREIEISTKKIGGGGSRCEATMLVLQKHRHRPRPLSRRHQPIFSYS